MMPLPPVKPFRRAFLTLPGRMFGNAYWRRRIGDALLMLLVVLIVVGFVASLVWLGYRAHA